MTEQFATVNDNRIISGNICIPFYGIWTALVILATSATINPSITLKIANLTMKGTAYRMASFSGSRSVLIVGGKAGWRDQISEQSYYNTNGLKKSLLLRDAASAVGESINLGFDDVIGTHYIRESAVAERTLRDIAGDVWWMDNNGVTQVKDRTNFAKITSEFTVANWSGAKGKFEIATEDVASFMPARTFTSPTVTSLQTISLTSIVVDNSGKLRLEVLSVGHENEG